jgi:glycosyltransferase involved in cell wall biosynthesis
LPREETIDGVRIYHPRYLAIPKVFRFSHGFTFGVSVNKALNSIRPEYKFELISVHWLFPDAFGTVLAARAMKVPVVAHALGCDVNDYLRYPLRRKMIYWALAKATAVVAKSEEMADKIIGLGIDKRKVEAIHNGVDRSLFHRRDQAEQRLALQLPTQGKIVLFIGNLSPEKGITYLLQAVSRLRRGGTELILCMIGEGPLRGEIEKEVRFLGIEDRTMLLGRVRHDRIPYFLNAADALCLPSLREGCPNVVLEALSSGTPVVASAVGAIPEMMTRTRIGFVTEPGDVPALSDKLLQALCLNVDVDRSFEWGGWEQNADAISSVFTRSIEAMARA